jgi:xanthine dehydrogenase molybdopterin-binding subunit B
MTVLDQRQAGVEERTAHATGSLADRPSGSKVGLELPHEAADLHVTGAALYTDDLIMRTSGVLHAWPVQAPHARALITDLRVKPAYDVDGVVRVLTAEDVPGVNDAGIKHDEPLFPSEVMFHGHAVCWVLGETLDAARRGGGGDRGRLRAAAQPDDPHRGDRARVVPGPPAHRVPWRRGRRTGCRHPPVHR